MDIRKIIVALVAVLSVSYLYGESYYWRNPGKDWYSFNEKANWQCTPQKTEALLPPTENDDLDWLGKSAIMCIDMAGGKYSVGGYKNIDQHSDYASRTLRVKNGTLEFTGQIVTHMHTFESHENGKIIFAESSEIDFEWGGAINNIKGIGENSFFGIYGGVSVGSDLKVQNNSTAILEFAPKSMTLINGSQTENHEFINNGTMKFPKGLAFNRTSALNRGGGVFTFKQNSGIMEMGGQIEVMNDVDRIHFELNGGKLAINCDYDMSKFHRTGMPTPESSAEIIIAQDKELKINNFKYAQGTTLKVTGGGTFVACGDMPSKLNMEGLSAFDFMGDIKFNEVEAFEGVEFIASSSSFCVTSATTQFLEKIAASFNAKSDWCATLEGNVLSVSYLPEADIVFYWQGQSGAWSDFSDPANWLCGEEKRVPRFAPGETATLDWLDSYSSIQLILNGNYRAKGISGEYKDYHFRKFMVMNGTLELIGESLTHYHTIEAWHDGKLVFARDSKIDFEWGGANNVLKTSAENAEIDLYGDVTVGSVLCATNVADATMEIAPKSWTYINGSQAANHEFVNYGTMKFSNGLVLNRTGVLNNGGAVVSLKQMEGVLELGGSIKVNSPVDTVNFYLEGGKLKATSNVDMAEMSFAGVSKENVSAEVEVAADSLLNWANSTFASGAALTVYGSGVLALGSLPSYLLLQPGATLKLAKANATLGEISGLDNEGVQVLLDESLLKKDAVLATSSDLALLKLVASKINSALNDDRWQCEIEGSSLVMRRLFKGLLMIVR